MFLIYTPPFHAVFGGSHKLLPLYWLIPIAFGCLILVWSCIRVLLARRSMERTRVKDIKGLMMCRFHSCSRGERIPSSDQHCSLSPNDAYDEYALTTLSTTSVENDQVTRCIRLYTHSRPSMITLMRSDFWSHTPSKRPYSYNKPQIRGV